VIVSRKAILWTSYKEHKTKEEKNYKKQGPYPEGTHWKQCSKIPYPRAWNSEQGPAVGGGKSTETFITNCQEENEN